MGSLLNSWRVSCTLLMLLLVASVSAQTSNTYSSSPRAVLKQDDSTIPQFTIQIDDYSSLTAAVEFGYELPFSEDSLGLARYRTNEGVYRYILALGTFYSVEEAQEVLTDMCPSLSLNACQVRYLGDLESLDSDGSESNQFAVVAPAESLPEVREEALPDVPFEELSIVNGVVSDFGDKVYDGEIVYTVQVAAMYEESDADRIADQIPVNLGSAEVTAVYSAKGNVVYSVTIGRFAYKKNGQAFADDLCVRLDLVDCWVKPLALVEKTKVAEW